MTEDTIKKICYTKAEVDAMVAEAVEEARRIDEASMAKHNREATVHQYDSWIHLSCFVP